MQMSLHLSLCLHTCLYTCFYASMPLSLCVSMSLHLSPCLYTCLYVAKPLCLYAATPLCLCAATPLCLWAATPLCLCAATPLCLYTCLFARLVHMSTRVHVCHLSLSLSLSHTHTHTHTQIYYWALRAPYFSAKEKTSRLIYKDPRLQTVYDMGPNWMTWYAAFFGFIFICLMEQESSLHSAYE